jgi:hypothetical protein
MRKVIYALSIGIFSSLFLSCKTPKEPLSGVESEKAIVVGTVSLSDSCGVSIEIIGLKGKASEKGELLFPKTLYPVNLEDKFKKEGQKLQFQYVYSRAMSPENCQVDAVVSLVNVKAK